MNSLERIAAAVEEIEAWPYGEPVTQDMFDRMVANHKLTSREAEKACDRGIRWRVDRVIERQGQSTQRVLDMGDKIVVLARHQAEIEVLRTPLPWSKPFLEQRIDAVADYWACEFTGIYEDGDEATKDAVALVCHQARLAFCERAVELMATSTPEVRA